MAQSNCGIRQRKDGKKLLNKFNLEMGYTKFIGCSNQIADYVQWTVMRNVLDHWHGIHLL